MSVELNQIRRILPIAFTGLTNLITSNRHLPLVNVQTLLFSDKFCKIDWEAVRVIKTLYIRSRQNFQASGLALTSVFVQHGLDLKCLRMPTLRRVELEPVVHANPKDPYTVLVASEE